jgi:hypothetical protein
MKTKLPASINSIKEAKSFLQKLNDNGEAYHPECGAHNVEWEASTTASQEEKDQLDKLMTDIYNLPGNDGRRTAPLAFDPCAYLFHLYHLTHV